MEIYKGQNLQSLDAVLDVFLYRNDFRELCQEKIINLTIEKVADRISNYIYQNYLPDILEKISPEALANMTIAEAGAKINETLQKKLPDKILEIEKINTKTEVYQKGLFGGLKRIR